MKLWIHTNHPCYGTDVVASDDDLSGQGYSRAFLDGIPSWEDDAPDWANWLAKDEDGVWYWYENAPVARNDLRRWDIWAGRFLKAGVTLHPDWQDSLAMRPQDQSLTTPEQGAGGNDSDDTMDEYDRKIQEMERRFGGKWQELCLNLVNVPAAEALDRLWKDVILSRQPNYRGWLYPGQAYRHLAAEYRDARKRALLDAAAAICQHCHEEMFGGRLTVEYDDDVKQWVHDDWHTCDAAAIHKLISLEAK